MNRFLPYPLLALGLASCASNGLLFLATEEGRIHAEEQVAGRRIARALLRFGPAVREMLGVEGDAETPDVYYQKHSGLEHGITAACFPTRIVLDEAGLSDLEFSVAHELVHWYLPRSVFANLPLFAEEGLAAYVGLSFFPPFQEVVGGGRRWSSTPPLASHLYLDGDGWYQLNPDERSKLGGLAVEVVYRIGLEKLREICEEGDPSIPTLLEHAGLYDPARSGQPDPTP